MAGPHARASQHMGQASCPCNVTALLVSVTPVCICVVLQPCRALVALGDKSSHERERKKKKTQKRGTSTKRRGAWDGKRVTSREAGITCRLLHKGVASKLRLYEFTEPKLLSIGSHLSPLALKYHLTWWCWRPGSEAYDSHANRAGNLSRQQRHRTSGRRPAAWSSPVKACSCTLGPGTPGHMHPSMVTSSGTICVCFLKQLFEIVTKNTGGLSVSSLRKGHASLLLYCSNFNICGGAHSGTCIFTSTRGKKCSKTPWHHSYFQCCLQPNARELGAESRTQKKKLGRKKRGPGRLTPVPLPAV